MSELSKQALKVDNNQSFPNNNSGAITPAILRSFNEDMIDSTVNQTIYTADSASFTDRIDVLDGRVDVLEAFSSSQHDLNQTLATTGSNTFVGNQTIEGSLTISNGGLDIEITSEPLDTTLKINNNLSVDGNLVADLPLGYVWLGDSSGRAVAVPSSSIAAGGSTDLGPLNAYTASNNQKWDTIGSQSGSWVTESETGSFARTNVTNTFTATQNIQGGLNVTGTITATEIHTIIESSSVIFSSGSNILGDDPNTDTQTLYGAVTIHGSETILGGGLDLKANAEGSGSAYTGVTAIVDTTTDPTNVYSAFQLIKPGGDSLIAIAANSYTSQYPGETIPILFGGGNNPDGNNAGIALPTNGQMDVWKKSNFKYGIDVTGSVRLTPASVSNNAAYPIPFISGSTISKDSVDTLTYNPSTNTLRLTGSVIGNKVGAFDFDSIFLGSQLGGSTANGTFFGYGSSDYQFILGAYAGGFDNELKITANNTGIEFGDFNGLAYPTWLKLIPNNGSNPAPQFTRGIDVINGSSVTLQSNTEGSGSAYASVTVKVDADTDPTNVYSALQLVKPNGDALMAMAANSYTPQYSGITIPMLFGGGNNPDGNNAGIAFPTNGQMDVWKKSNFKYGVETTGSLNVSGAGSIKGGLFVTGGNLVVQDNNISTNKNLTIGQDATISGNVDASGNVNVYNQYGGINIKQNANGSGSQYPGMNITVAPNVYPTDIFGGFSILTEQGAALGQTFLGMASSTYSPQYFGTNVPCIIANGNNPGGNDTAIIWTSNGNAEHWKKSVFKYGVAVTGSVNGNVNTQSISSATASFDFNASNFFELNLQDGTNTRVEATNVKPGQTINVLVKQAPLTGGGTITFSDAFKFPAVSPYTASADPATQDILTFVTFADTSSIYSVAVKNMI